MTAPSPLGRGGPTRRFGRFVPFPFEAGVGRLARVGPVEADLNATIRQLHASTAKLTRSDGEDLVQEALTRAIAHGVPTDAVPWLRTVTRRLAIDRSRRTREVASGGSPELERLAGAVVVGPEDELLSREERLAVREALATLSPRYREALTIYAETGDARAVSDRLNLTSNATHTLLCRARQGLRRALDRAGFAPGVALVRIQRWMDPLVAGCVAATVAVTAALAPSSSSAADIQPRPAGRVVSATAAAPTAGEAGAPVTAPAGSKEAAATVASVPTPAGDRETPVNVQIGCRPEQDDGDGGLVLGVRYEDGPRHSVVDEAVGKLDPPESQRTSDGCGP